MTAERQRLITGHHLCKDYTELWAFCEFCIDLLGGDPMIIAEHATAANIEPWPSAEKQAWTRGRLFGVQGEVQWRSYGTVLRVAVLVEAVDDTAAQTITQKLNHLGVETIDDTHYQVNPQTMALETNEDEYTRAQIRSYGDEQSPHLFVRYCQVQ